MKDVLEGLNDQQVKAVKAIDGPIQVLAGAGSGKTRVLTHRIAYMIQQGIDPFRILAITFTRKAANEMKDRLISTVGRKATCVQASTFHSFCLQRIVREYSDELGYDSTPQIASFYERKKIIQEAIEKVAPKTKMAIEQGDLKVGDIMGRISDLKNQLLTPAEFMRKVERQHDEQDLDTELQGIYEVYQERLNNQNALDFEDLIMKSTLLVEDNIEVRRQLQKQFKYFCVDEYQDTNHAQYTLIKTLAEDSQNLFAVGDVDQSIYGWRGADIGNIIRFKKDFPQAKIIRLEQNYRSTKNIINASNELINNNTERLEKTSWTDNPEGEKVHLIECAHDVEESTVVRKIIQDKIKDGGHYSDFVILSRTNGLCNWILNELQDEGIPSMLIQGAGLLGDPMIKTIIKYLSFLVKPTDDKVSELMNEPRRGIGKVTLSKMTGVAEDLGCDNLTALQEIVNGNEINHKYHIGPVTQDKFRGALNILTKVLEINDDFHFDNLIERIDFIVGLVERLEENAQDEARRKIKELQELLDKYLDEQSVEDESFNELDDKDKLQEFLTYIELEEDKPVEDKDLVKISTIHKVKGLEFKNVILINFNEDSLPSYFAVRDEMFNRTDEDVPAIQEERRLAYVAMTRAQDELYLLSSAAKGYGINKDEGYKMTEEPSRFANELGKKNTETFEDAKDFVKLDEGMVFENNGKVNTILGIEWNHDKTKVIAVKVIDEKGRTKIISGKDPYLNEINKYYQEKNYRIK